MRNVMIRSAAAAATAAALLCACGAPPQPLSRPAPPRSVMRRAQAQRRPRSVVIGVLFAGWHTGLILPVDELGPLRAMLPVYPAARYVSFGWGNRRFYMAPNPTIAEALEALVRSASTVLVEGAPTVAALLPPEATYRWLCADRTQILRVDNYLRASLRTRNGKAIIIGAGPSSDSDFLASDMYYDALNTCNTWTASALAEAGFPLSASGIIFSEQVRDRVRKVSICRHTRGSDSSTSRLLPRRRIRTLTAAAEVEILSAAHKSAPPSSAMNRVNQQGSPIRGFGLRAMDHSLAVGREYGR